MRMESDKDRSKQNRKEPLCEDSIVQRKTCTNSLGIQRCHSDGVLTQQNGYSKRRPASKSSSEASIDGPQDPEEILIAQGYANGFVTNGACALDNNLNTDDAIERKRTRNNKKDFLHQQSCIKKDSTNVKNVKTWSQRAVERRQASSTTSTHHEDSDDDQVPMLLNGLELNVDLSADRSNYSSSVCNTYRHEADILHGRTRGGVKNDTYLKHLVDTVPSRLDNSNSVDDMLICSSYHSNSNSTESVEGLESQPPNYQMVVAPLAIPENLSDEEITSCNGSIENHSEQNQQSPGGITSNVSDRCDADRAQDVSNEALFSSHPDNISNGAHSNSNDKGCSEMPDCGQVAEDEGISNSEECEDGDDNVENEEDENREQILEQTRPSSSSSFDSIDDIGDFIEADLPPNVERLAFFARESSSSSTTDEDEGCGDEVLPNPNEDEESENETIDPLTHAEKQNVSGEITSESGIKLLNNTSADLLSYSNDFTNGPYAFMNTKSDSGACNIVCNKSTDDNECVGEISNSAQAIGWEEGNRFSMESNDSDCFDNSGFSDTDRRSGLPLERRFYCVSCDKLVDKDSQRQDESMAVYCDKCYYERELERNKRSDDVIRNKLRPVQHSSTTSRHFLINNSEKRNSNDKVTNASNLLVRLSSSDSDPFDRLYVSDSSELVSPDAETGLESVLPSSSISSNGSSVQYNQINSINNDSGGRPLAGSMVFQRHSLSLEYDTPDEVLYCPYYTRRSRSLDQELSVNGLFNRSPEREDPFISASRSNFQEDESNNQEKIFEKQPYHVEAPIPTYSSSDEEENTRVPAPYPNNANDLQEIDEAGIQSDANSMVFSHEMNHHEFDMTGQNNVVVDEPIYEDIEDLLEVCGNDGESENRSQSHPICLAILKLRNKKRSRSPVSDVEKVMIWNEYEAYVVQVKQIGTSACGPTAVLNVLKAFDFQVEKEEVTQKISSTMRMEGAPIPYYLFSRYSAGTTAEALVDGVSTVTRGAIKGRFFHFYPKRDVDLLKWLGHWMKKGAVPVATLNLQRGVKPGWTIPDAWHHQMVYGVSSKGVYLTNPLEIVPESVIMEQLTSDSVLLVRKQDVVSRFRDWCPLNEILKQRDPRWMTMNVLGQIVHMLREQCMPQDQLATMRSQLTSHICIPAAYKAGIILYMRSNSEFFDELMQAPELPLKDDCERS